MLKADKLRLQALASSDESERVAAAAALDQLEPGHFEEHPVSVALVRRLSASLLAAHRESKDDAVKRWVVQFLAEAGIESPEVDELVAASLIPSCTFLPTLLYYVSTKVTRYGHVKDAVKRLSTHPDDQVRWRCALVLHGMPLDYAEDAETLRRLALERYPTARTYAVLAMKNIGVREEIDRLTLQRVAAIEGAAKHYALELLST
jgi:hypothetical protein